MDKYLKIIKEADGKKEYVRSFFESNGVEYVMMDIVGDEVILRMDSANRFKFTLVSEEFASYLKSKNLHFKVK